jgi:hypothetical protein
MRSKIYKRVALIAAGGYATRMNSSIPKSLLTVNDISYLELLLKQIDLLEFDKVVIFCNRINYIDQIKSIAIKYSNCIVVVHIGAESTFDLFKFGYSEFPSSEYLFFYGHSPRKADEISCLFDIDFPLVISLYSKSSKKSIIKSNSNFFIEPPYKISSLELEISNYINWNDFLSDHTYGSVYFNTPNEFNNRAEEKKYREYAKAL